MTWEHSILQHLAKTQISFPTHSIPQQFSDLIWHTWTSLRFRFANSFSSSMVHTYGQIDASFSAQNLRKIKNEMPTWLAWANCSGKVWSFRLIFRETLRSIQRPAGCWRLVVFDGIARKKTGAKNGTKLWSPRKKAFTLYGTEWY